jgi:outer membrane protein TolC
MKQTNWYQIFQVILIISIFVTNIFVMNSYAQTKPDEKAKNAKEADSKDAGKGEKSDKTAPELEGVVPSTPLTKLKKASLTVEEAIKIVLDNNLDLQEAKYNILMSDSMFKKNNKKYAWTLFGRVARSYHQTPVEQQQTFQGKDSSTNTFESGIEKRFSTGTALRLALNHNYTSTTAGGSSITNPVTGEPITLFNPDYYNTQIQLSVVQELLKTFFGENDRLVDRQLYNSGLILKFSLIDTLNKLVVQAILDYWNLTTAEKNLETAELQLKNAIFIRNILIRKRRSGLAETFEINQYNAQVASAESNLEFAKRQLTDAKIKILSTMNLPPGTTIKGVTELTEELPQSLEFEKSYQAALKNRWDLKILLMEYENAKIKKKLADNNALPSLQLEGSLISKGESAKDASTTFGDASSLGFYDWSIGIRATYPLWDEEVKTNLRDAQLTSKAKEVALKKIKINIRDEIKIRLGDVQTKHKMLEHTKKTEKESRAHYANLSREFRKGRFSVTQVTTAHNNLISSRYAVVGARVRYNIALLQLDLARNTIFQKYGVNVEKYIKSFQQKLESRQ